MSTVVIADVFGPLVHAPRWVAWKYETRNGKRTKPPYSPVTGRRTDATRPNPGEHVTLEVALAYVERANMDGVGIVLGDGLGGGDLDACRNPRTGGIAPWAQEWVDRFATYTEISPSDVGLKFLAFGAPETVPCNEMSMDTPPINGKAPEIAVYPSGRYFTVTGRLLDGCPDEIRDCGELGGPWDRMVHRLREHSTNGTGPDRETVQPTGATELSAGLRAALEGDGKAARLWREGKDGGTDRSRNDAALAGTLGALGFGNEQIEAAIRSYPMGQVHQEADTPGYDVDRQLSRLLGLAGAARKKRDEDEPEREGTGTENLTDLGNARRLVARHGGDLRYVPSRKRWISWDGRRWSWDDDGEVVRRAKDTVRAIYGEASKASDSKAREALAKWATKSESEARIKAMISLAETEPEIPVSMDDLDADPRLFNVRNGTIDLRTGRLRPHDPGDLITKLVNIEYDPSATSLRWDAFLGEVATKVRGFLQRAVGYSLTGLTTEQLLFLLWGTGQNGKSVFLEIVREILGDYAKQADASVFLASRTDNVRNDLARLAGARFVSAIEADEGRKLAEALVKLLTGGDTVTARFLYSEYFEFKPEFKPWIAANHKPVIRGTDYAIWRRVRLVPFTYTVPEAKRDRKLPDRLREELPGILAWAVRGCLDWQENGLREPDAVTSATDAYREEMDPLAGFLEDRCVLEDSAAISAKDLYAAYSRWAEENGEKPLSQTWMGRKLTERGLGSEKSGPKNLTHRTGIRLRGEFST